MQGLYPVFKKELSDHFSSYRFVILFALIGPKGAPAQHLRILAQVSRLLKSAVFREQLLSAGAASEVYDLIRASEGKAKS